MVDAITRNDVEGDAENQTGYLKEFELYVVSGTGGRSRRS